MSERHFDYTAMQEAYQGLETEFSNIADVLDGIDRQYRDAVNVSDEAIFGDLGSQLLLDWDNTSSNFTSFMTNFENWSAVVAASGGNYATFENDIAGFKSVDNGSYLGVSAQLNGVTTNYVDSSAYNNAYSADEIMSFKDAIKYYELTGADYIDTEMVAYAKKNKIWNIVGDVVSVASIVASGFTLFKYGKAVLGTAAKAGGKLGLKGIAGQATSAANRALLGTAKGSRSAVWAGLKATEKFKYAAKIGGYYAKVAGKAITNTPVGTALKIAAIGGTVGGNASNIMHGNAGYDGNSQYAQGNVYTIGGTDYAFLGATPGGQKLYTDPDGKIYYEKSDGTVDQVLIEDSNNSFVPATAENIDDSYKLDIGGEIIDETVQLTPNIVNNYRELYENTRIDIQGTYDKNYVSSNPEYINGEEGDPNIMEGENFDPVSGYRGANGITQAGVGIANPTAKELS